MQSRSLTRCLDSDGRPWSWCAFDLDPPGPVRVVVEVEVEGLEPCAPDFARPEEVPLEEPWPPPDFAATSTLRARANAKAASGSRLEPRASVAYLSLCIACGFLFTLELPALALEILQLHLTFLSEPLLLVA